MAAPAGTNQSSHQMMDIKVSDVRPKYAARSLARVEVVVPGR
jgi:hypothetical protein